MSHTQKDIRLCRKSAGQGGFTKEEVAELAKSLRVACEAPKKLKKDDLCSLILEEHFRTLPARPDRPDNQRIAGLLDLLAEKFEKDGEAYKAKAFQEIGPFIRGLPVPLVDVGQLSGIKGVGTGVTDRVLEILITGNLQELGPVGDIVAAGPSGASAPEDTKEEKTRLDLLRVYGLGEKAVEKLMAKGVEGVEDLRKKVEAEDIVLTHAQSIGLEFLEDFEERIPRSEIRKIGKCIITVVVPAKHPANTAEIVGSYRRGGETSGDIDILLTNKEGENTLGEIVECLRQVGLIRHILSLGAVKFQGTYWSGFPAQSGTLRKMDIRYVPPEDWSTSLVHSTGSDQLNKKMRRIALEKEMTLSEHGLFEYKDKRKGKRISVDTEADVFRILGIRFLTPEERTRTVVLVPLSEC